MEFFTSVDEIVTSWKQKLANDPVWIECGLKRIFEYQTADERHNQDVRNNNGVGFTTADAYMLSSFAKQLKYRKNYHLSEKQLAYAARRMPKYARQLVNQAIEKGKMVKENGMWRAAKPTQRFDMSHPNQSQVPQHNQPKAQWTNADEKRWIDYKNEFQRIEMEQEAEAFRSKMEYEMSLNGGR